MAAVLGGTEKNMWLVGLCGLKQENEVNANSLVFLKI